MSKTQSNIIQPGFPPAVRFEQINTASYGSSVLSLPTPHGVDVKVLGGRNNLEQTVAQIISGSFTVSWTPEDMQFAARKAVLQAEFMYQAINEHLIEKQKAEQAMQAAANEDESTAPESAEGTEEAQESPADAGVVAEAGESQ